MAEADRRGVPSRHLEVEIKLDADAEFRLPPLAGNRLLSAAGVAAVDSAEPVGLSAVYYDTERLDLLRSRLTLRRRTGGDDEGWHLKLPAGAGARTEVRLPLTAAGRSAAPEVPDALGSLARGAARGRDLVPVARIDTRRTAHRLRDASGAALVEIADDAVTGTGLLPGAQPARRWREIEVELTGGTDAHLAAVADALQAAGARPASAASKVGRLLDRHGAGRQPVTNSTAVTVAPSAAPALVGYLAVQRDLLIDADVRLRAPDPDREAAHDARAAARRIRSVLRVYRPLFRGPLGALTGSLRRVGAVLSPVRDLDVALDRLESLFADRPGAGEVRPRLTAWRVERLDRLRREMDDGEYLHLLRACDELADDPPLTGAAASPGPDVTAVLLTAAWLRLRANAEAALVPGAAPDLIHRVRKRAKTVRYAADAAADAAGATAAAIAGRMHEVQDVLGEHQDAVTAGQLAGELACAPGLSDAAADLLAEWRHTESERRATTLSAFAALLPTLPVLPPAP